MFSVDRKERESHSEVGNAIGNLGPFGGSAAQLVTHGLVPLPCGGQDGKRPLIKNYNSISLAGIRSRLDGLIAQFGRSNVGVACQQSNLVIVDIDDPSLLDEMLSRFGETPLVTRSPSSGFHAYYKDDGTGIRCHNLRHSEGLPVDIKGVGGIIIVPPSVNPRTGIRYHFESGDWNELECIPVIRGDTLHAKPVAASRRSNASSVSSGRTPEGERNNELFRYLLRQASACDDVDVLIDVAMSWNDNQAASPLPEAEVIGAARSAWRYEQDGNNWVGQEARTIISRETLFRFAGHPKGGDALMLWAYLEAQHAKRGSLLVLDREAMAANNVLPAWTAWRYRAAI